MNVPLNRVNLIFFCCCCITLKTFLPSFLCAGNSKLERDFLRGEMTLTFNFLAGMMAKNENKQLTNKTVILALQVYAKITKGEVASEDPPELFLKKMNAGIADGLRLLTIRFSCSFKFKSESKKPFVSVSFQHILMDFPSAGKCLLLCVFNKFTTLTRFLVCCDVAAPPFLGGRGMINKNKS